MGDEEIFNVIVGKNISRMRAVHGLTQEELAKALHVSLEEAQEYENGGNAVSPAKLFQLAGLFRCSIDTLCGVGRQGACYLHE